MANNKDEYDLVRGSRSSTARALFFLLFFSSPCSPAGQAEFAAYDEENVEEAGDAAAGLEKKETEK